MFTDGNMEIYQAVDKLLRERNIHRIAQYYSLLKMTLENHLMGCPNRIYNMDESGMLSVHKPPKDVAWKTQK